MSHVSASLRALLTSFCTPTSNNILPDWASKGLKFWAIGLMLIICLRLSTEQPSQLHLNWIDETVWCCEWLDNLVLEPITCECSYPQEVPTPGSSPVNSSRQMLQTSSSDSITRIAFLNGSFTSLTTDPSGTSLPDLLELAISLLSALLAIFTPLSPYLNTPAWHSWRNRQFT